MGITYPNWNGTARVGIEQIVARDTFQLLHPTMRRRVQDLIVGSGGRVGLLEGHRSAQAQERMFLERYVPDPAGTVTWNGRRWRHVSGATAAPPGRSMHELGLATDLSGDMTWIVANATTFGLKHFANVNAEPWHVQPVELPNGRSDYERLGSPWAIVDAGTNDAPASTTPAGAATPPAGVPGEVLPGARGEGVRRLQEVLIGLGLIGDTPGNRDGHYGSATQAVVRDFQRRHGLADDARVGPRTWAVLLALAPAGT